MIDATYGDKIVLRDGEAGIVAGFLGRGRNALILKLKPAANGNRRERVVRAKDIAQIVKAED